MGLTKRCLPAVCCLAIVAGYLSAMDCMEKAEISRQGDMCDDCIIDGISAYECREFQGLAEDCVESHTDGSTCYLTPQLCPGDMYWSISGGCGDGLYVGPCGENEYHEFLHPVAVEGMGGPDCQGQGGGGMPMPPMP